MSRKLTLTLALATAATIATASLVTSASAHIGGGIGGGSHFSGRGSFGGRIGGNTHVGGGSRVGRGDGDRGGHDRGGRDPGRDHDRPGHWAFHGHGHWVFRGGRWIILDEAVLGVDGPIDGPVAAPVAGPGPCTCLTKTYTPDGLVVFADVCTKEAASAPVNGAEGNTPVPPAPQKSGDASQAPTSPNFAGLTYQEFLAAQKN